MALDIAVGKADAGTVKLDDKTYNYPMLIIARQVLNTEVVWQSDLKLEI